MDDVVANFCRVHAIQSSLLSKFVYKTIGIEQQPVEELSNHGHGPAPAC